MIQIKHLLFALLLFTSLNIKAQTTTSLPQIFELRSDTVANYELDAGHWQLLIDADGKYTFDEVQRMPFMVITKQSPVFDKSIKIKWTRYRIVNTLDHSLAIYIPEEIGHGVGTVGLNHAEIYTMVTGGKWVHGMTGNLIPLKDITSYKRIKGFYFTLTPGRECTFYERVYNEYGDTAGVSIKVLKSIPDDVITHYEIYLSRIKGSAFLLAFILLSGLMGLFFYNSSHESTYLYFALFNLIYGVDRFLSLSSDWLYPNMPSLSGILPIMSVVTAYFFGRFAYSFYQTALYFPKWTRLSIKYSYSLSILCTTFFFHVPVAVTVIAAAAWVVFFINLLVISICGILKNRGELLFNALTIIPFLLSFLVGLLFLTIDSESMAGYSVIGGYCWMVVMFLMKLVMRYKVLQQKILTEALEREKVAKENEIEKNQLIAGQKLELELQVTARTAELSRSLVDLRQAQAQLVQSEKMASLGELTAGIAHEIQNPLNFVNNFSELNREMIAELKLALQANDLEEALVIAGDMDLNEEKIHHHGIRAGSIVKGMLEHSRASSGQKEATDLNKLADEYLRLAYHGLRAKDKTFNAQLITNFDKMLPPINVVPQDIGRVLLNLCNNAFYTIQQKQKIADDGYLPAVTLTTSVKNGHVQVAVADNGSGIPDAIKDKILQPFFTTKPTGQGTGLGLSLSYDIIVKGHNGKLNIETTPGEGATFTIELPG